jgi:CIC family chloride channel protein
MFFKIKDLPDLILLTSLTTIIGILAGFGAILTEFLVEIVHHSFFEQKLWGLLNWAGDYHLIIIPAIGGIIFGSIIINFARDARGHGVSEVLEAVAVRGGRIPPKVGIVKSISSSFCIGTGGSVGLEGPIAQIGAAIGSSVGQFFHLTEERIRLFLACGAGAGISATFHAPITGTIFAIEIILGHLEARYFSAVVISAVIANTIAQFHKTSILTVPIYNLVSFWELFLYAILGVIIAFGAMAFIKVLHSMEDFWEKLPISDYLKPVLGGALLGIIGMIAFFQVDGMPRFFGIGYESINDALNGSLVIELIFALFVIKIFTTSLTLGSGGSGGTFTPSLFMGAMLGGSFGHLVNTLFPMMTAPVGAYALVGMAAFFAGAAHAPLTSIILAVELTGNYNLILPIMLATVISTLVTNSIHSNSMYTIKLAQRGIKVRRGAPGHELDLMETITVGEAMTKQVETVPLTMSLMKLMEKFDQSTHKGFPVVNEEGELMGIVSIKDLDNAIASGNIEGRAVSEITTTDLLIAYPYEPMQVALERLALRDISRLPVVQEEGSRKLVGILLRKDIINAYRDNQ